MRETSRRIQAHNRQGSSAYAGWLADLRAGIVRLGEPRAIRSAGRFVATLPAHARSGAIRAAAIRAINYDVPQGNVSLGHSFYRLSHKEGGDSIAEQVETLPLLHLDAAAILLDGLIGRCSRSTIPVNFFELATTLSMWGHDGGTGTRDRRNRIIFDFYSVDPEQPILTIPIDQELEKQ